MLETSTTVWGMLTTDWFWLALGRGLWLTVQIAGLTILLSFIFGTIIGVARFSKIPVLSQLATVYIELIRNIPLVLIILAMFLIAQLRDVTAAITGLTVFTSAIIAEIVRGGLNAIPKGQWEAARSQGMSYIQILQHIVLPQAVVKMIPPIVSQFVTAIKDSAFAMYIGVFELVRQSDVLKGLFTSVNQVLTIYAVVAAAYFVVNFILSSIARHLQKTMSEGQGAIGS
jgi:putative glutamine transport system permease protein